jgi:hypothetical protein
VSTLAFRLFYLQAMHLLCSIATTVGKESVLAATRESLRRKVSEVHLSGLFLESVERSAPATYAESNSKLLIMLSKLIDEHPMHGI